MEVIQQVYSSGEHIFWHNLVGRHAVLDVGEVLGYGSGTITFKEREQGHPQMYAVHNYSDQL